MKKLESKLFDKFINQKIDLKDNELGGARGATNSSRSTYVTTNGDQWICVDNTAGESLCRLKDNGNSID
jgi:hypothetical protein